jgi:hypothetical protein
VRRAVAIAQAFAAQPLKAEGFTLSRASRLDVLESLQYE